MKVTGKETIDRQETESRNIPGPDTRHGPGPELMSAHSLTGNKVLNQKGDEVGVIKSIMLDTRSGAVAYAVLAYGGFLGKGEKLFAVPWNALTLDTANRCFNLNVEIDRLKQATGFNRDRWPDSADSSWSREAHNFSGTLPHWENPQD